MYCGDQRVCVLPKQDCNPGEADCACSGGGCNSGLACVNNVCRASIGFIGGPCIDENHCHTAARCASDVCVACSPGEQGCTCGTGGACNETLKCTDSICVADTGYAAAPATATPAACVTPCSGGMVAPDGSWVACPSDGVMDGCLPGLTCAQGQCLCSGSKPKTCTADVSCPDFQTCLNGFCRANCSLDTDCRSGAVCHRRVCRKACDIGTPNCPSGNVCEPLDGQKGVCLMRADSVVSAPASAATLTLSRTVMRFTPNLTQNSFSITNTSAFDSPVVIRHARQRQADALTQQPTKLELLERETPPAVDSGACTTGTLGCRCGPDTSHPCVTLTQSYALACETNICKLPTCQGGTEGCFCNGTDCRRLCEAGRCPLEWLQLTAALGNTNLVSKSTDVVVGLTIPAGQTATITIDSPAQGGPWDGALEVEPAGGGATRQLVALNYANTPDGVWSGSAYYFGDFLVNDAGLAAWGAQRATITTDPSFNGTINNLGNAFLEAWANFRRGTISYRTFLAILVATRTESWKSGTLQAKCGVGEICYPDDSPQGFDVYTDTPNQAPVPGAVVELPFAMTLQGVNSTFYQGAVDSTVALQYPGSPAIGIGFQGDPGACTPGADGNCISFLSTLTMSSAVGGRYDQGSGTCPAPFQSVSMPWLLTDFIGRSRDNGAGGRATVECRVGDLGAANPMLDGTANTRSMDIIDGAIINGNNLLILFRERTQPLVAGAADSGVVAYGILSLARQNAAPQAFMPMPPSPAPTPPASAKPDLSCASATDVLAPIAVQEKYADVPTMLASGAWVLITRALITGSVADPNTNPPTLTVANTWTQGSEQVHFLCEDNRLFDGGPARGTPCPSGSRVLYFTVNPSINVPGQSCQSNATCDTQLQNWIKQGGVVVQSQPVWRCVDGSNTCSLDSFDLRSGKAFYTQSSTALYLPLGSAVAEAFAYRTKFVNRAGTNLGFAPAVCGDSSQTLPYCYAPDQIVALQERHDCLIDIYLNHYDDLNPTGLDARLQQQITTALHSAFADTSATEPGFEKLYAELLVMLGDNAYVHALSSRFDLAGLSIANFQGSQLEAGGINLSGVAGAEMVSLYSATQYYQLAIDRLSALLPQMWQIINSPAGSNVIGQETAVEFLSRVIRASSQKAEVENEIARHYQNFDRADLARAVIARGYTGAYLESMELTTLIKSLIPHLDPADVAQIQSTIGDAQLTYSAALQDMTKRYRSIGDNVNYFGLPSDYIPFPALEGLSANTTAFDIEIQRAREVTGIAGQAEVVALADNRDFDTDSVAFQNQLASIANNYESQLAEICGTFNANGTVYPAIKKYAALDPVAATYGDPCGRMGTGHLNDAILNIAIQQKAVQVVAANINSVLRQVQIEKDRIQAACKTEVDWNNAAIQLQSAEVTVQAEINSLNVVKDYIERSYQTTVNVIQSSKCMGPDCIEAFADAALIGVAGASANFDETLIESANVANQAELQQLQNTQANLQFKFMCNASGTGLLQIDSAAKVKDLITQMAQLKLEASKGEYQVAQAISQAHQLVNLATRLQAQEQQNFQLTINLEAARNNPNVRIYRNDAVINADNTFDSALTEAYRATRVFEYYTSQSYPDRDKLFLVRMVTSGDVNLTTYLVNLEAAFRSFQDTAGIPDLRVAVLSLRDDLIKIPYTNECGEPISTNQRVKLLQQQLSDPKALDSNGYIVVPFRIGPELVSPLTNNHKLQFVEAQIIGGRGDQVGRVYLRMAGAAMVATARKELDFFTFPGRTGVINVFFSVKPPEIDPGVFRTYHFADRPLMNSRWELVLNFKDEPSNLDFTIDDVSDVRLYLYYTDFTSY
jgi:hypothetical protein